MIGYQGLAISFSTSTAMLARRISSTAYARVPALGSTAVRNRLMLRSLAATGMPLRHVSQHPEGVDQTSPLASATESRTSHQKSAVKPKRQSALDRLGATRTVKVVIIVFLCIYGTMEGIFYTTWLYRYLTNKGMEGNSK